MRGFRGSPEPALPAGAIVAGTYRIGAEVARSAIGVVFEAHDAMLDRIVALKLAWRDPGTPSLIVEARRCAAVHDGCSVDIHGMGVHEGVEYAVAERVVGRLLRDDLQRPLTAELYLARLRKLVAAMACAHEAGIAVGDISSSTVLVTPEERLVLGRFSLSQVPSPDRDPEFAPQVDLRGLGTIAVEMAGGTATGSARLVDLRPDLPEELSDLVEWLRLDAAAERPRSARDVLLQLDVVNERVGRKNHPVRVLIVDDDAPRARWLWNLARRAHAAVLVEASGEGTDAAHKLNRDQPDIVFIDARLRGVMNALELCMYARGLDHQDGQIFLIGAVSPRDQMLFENVNVQVLPDDASLPDAILDRIRAVSHIKPRAGRPRSTVSG